MKCDFHIHTHYSFDGSASPQDIVDVAIEKGINCLAITDHRELKGAVIAKEYAKDKSILIIPGIEINSRQGDILGLNLKEVIPDKLSARETVKRIKGQGGTVIISHPFGFMCSFNKKMLKDMLLEIDGVEVLNNSLFRGNNKKALEFAQKHNLAFTAGSDSHSLNSVGKAYLEIPGEDLSVEEVLEAVKEKKGEVMGKEDGLFRKIIEHSKMLGAKLRQSNFPNFRL